MKCADRRAVKVIHSRARAEKNIYIHINIADARSLANYWASEASPTLGCSIEISRGMSVGMYVCRMSN